MIKNYYFFFILLLILFSITSIHSMEPDQAPFFSQVYRYVDEQSDFRAKNYSQAQNSKDPTQDDKKTHQKVIEEVITFMIPTYTLALAIPPHALRYFSNKCTALQDISAQERICAKNPSAETEEKILIKDKNSTPAANLKFFNMYFISESNWKPSLQSVGIAFYLNLFRSLYDPVINMQEWKDRNPIEYNNTKNISYCEDTRSLLKKPNLDIRAHMLADVPTQESLNNASTGLPRLTQLWVAYETMHNWNKPIHKKICKEKLLEDKGKKVFLWGTGITCLVTFFNCYRYWQPGLTTPGEILRKFGQELLSHKGTLAAIVTGAGLTTVAYVYQQIHGYKKNKLCDMLCPHQNNQTENQWAHLFETYNLKLDPHDETLKQQYSKFEETYLSKNFLNKFFKANEKKLLQMLASKDEKDKKNLSDMIPLGFDKDISTYEKEMHTVLLHRYIYKKPISTFVSKRYTLI